MICDGDSDQSSFSFCTVTESQHIQKACPIVMRKREGALEILAFKHPVAGCQIVKGGIRSGEQPETAALRELQEESGIASSSTKPRALGTTGGILPGEKWHFYLVAIHGLPEKWEHATKDDHGHVFSFFWQPVDEFLGNDWAKPFIRAIRYAVEKVEKIPASDQANFMDGVETPLRGKILEMVKERGSQKSICPSEVARAIAGDGENLWRKEMKPIREEAVRLAQEGRVTITRKGKPVDPLKFKGIYRISISDG